MSLSVDIETVDEDEWKNRGVFWTSNFSVFPIGSRVDIWDNGGTGWMCVPHDHWSPVDASNHFRKSARMMDWCRQ